MSSKVPAVDQILAEALKAVEDAAVPNDLRAVAFEKAVEIIAARAGVPVVAAVAAPAAPAGDPSGGGDRDGSGGAASTKPAEAKTLERVAAGLKADLADVKEVFHIEDGEPKLVVATSQLEDGTADAAEQIAVLLAAARQVGGWGEDGWTASSVIRQAADDYGKKDGNFARTLSAMKDEFNFTGKRTGVKVKVKRRGKERAAEIVGALASGTS
jgi:hypothetical protein